MTELEKLREEYEKLKEREEALQIALSLTNHVVTYVDLKKHTLMHIHHEGNFDGITTLMENVPESIIESGIIHPEDEEGYREFFRGMYKGNPSGSYILRSRENDKGWLWFEIRYKTVFDSKGNPLRAICFSDDVTVEKTAELRYQQYKDVVSSGADFVWEIDLNEDAVLSVSGDMYLVFKDTKITNYTDLAKAGLTGITDEKLRSEAAVLFSSKNLISCYRNAKRDVTLSYPYNFNDGSGIHYMSITAHLRSSAEGHIHAIICASDITSTHQAMAALQDKAETDPLTRLYNRDGLDSRISSVLESSSSDLTHGYIIFDIDDFKHANDNYGHSFGDEVLVHVADTMRSTFKQNDVLCRLGGDEFVIFMQNVEDINLVISKANALRSNLFKLSKERKLPFKISISLGATLYIFGEEISDMYKRADKALYKSKESGKDKVSYL